MRRPKIQQIRNKIDLTDRVHVRMMTKRFRLSEAELTALVGRIGNSIAAIGKEVSTQRASKLPTPVEVPPAAVIAAVTAPEAAPVELPAANESGP